MLVHLEAMQRNTNTVGDAEAEAAKEKITGPPTDTTAGHTGTYAPTIAVNVRPRRPGTNNAPKPVTPKADPL